MIDSIKWLRKYISFIKWGLCLSLLMLFLKTISSLLTIGIQKWIIDDVFLGNNLDLFVNYILLFAISSFIFICMFTIEPYVTEGLYNKLHLRISEDFLGHLQRIPFKGFQSNKVTDYVVNFTQDVRGVSELAARFFPNALNELFTATVLIIIIARSSPYLLIIIVVLSFIYILLGKYFGPKVKAVHKEVADNRSNLIVNIEEGVASTREVIAYHRLDWESKRYNRVFSKYFNSVMNEGKLTNKMLLAVDPFRWGINLSVIGLGGYLVIQGQLSIGLFIVLYFYSTQLMDKIKVIFDLFVIFMGRLANLARLKKVFDIEKEAEGSLALQETINEIRFEQTFLYFENENHPVLTNINTTFPIGKKIGIVGPSGSGKSTLAKILIRSYQPTKGNVIINNKKLNAINEEDWLSKISIVMQEPYLFQGTIRTNLLMGKKNIKEEDIIYACKAVKIYDYIVSLPDSFETLIGERGITLSGGQRQRIALARAILENPEILILDEATSALDVETEKYIQEQLDLIMKDRTMIIIAHRLSTIQNADKIYAIEKGEIVEEGTHHELLLNGNLYRELYKQK